MNGSTRLLKIRRTAWGVVGLLKGGSYGYSAADTRAAFRMGGTQSARWTYGGARLVMTQ